jgi:O-antigen/teichoic acid export membrane protein
MMLVGLTLEVVTIVAGARLANGVHRYYHKAESDADKRAVVSTALLMLTVTFGGLGLACWLLSPHLSRLVLSTTEHTVLFQLASASFGLQGLVIVPFAFLRVRERSGLYTVVTLIKLGMQVAMNIYFLAVAHLGAKGIFLSTLIATAITGLTLTGYVVRDVGLRFWDPAARSLLRYGVPLVGTQVASFFVTFGDRYFLQAYGDAATVGIYSLAYQFGFLVSAIGYQPFATMWEPMRFDAAKRPDKDQLFARAFGYMNLLLLVVCVATVVFVRDVLAVMADPAFHPAATLVPVLVLAYAIQAWFGFLEAGILVTERTEFVTLTTWVSAVVALLGYAALIPRWLGWGAAVATVLAFAARLVLTLRISQRLWPVRYDWGPAWRLGLASIVAAAAAVATPRWSLPASLAAHALIFVAYLGALWSLGVVPAADRARLLALVRRGSAG